MQITPLNTNNPNFQAFKVSSRTLKAMGCKKEDLLKNEFINKFSKEYDISIIGEDSSFFKKATSFCFSISNAAGFSFAKIPPLLQFKFKTSEELDSLIDGIKNKFYWLHSTSRYNVEYKAFKDLDSGKPFEFIAQMDYIMQMISDMPDTPEYAELRTYMVSVLQKLKFWKPIPKNNPNKPQLSESHWKNVNFDHSVALRALKNNNLELLKFLKSKGENLNECLDLLEKGQVPDEAKKILEGVKRQDAKIFALEDVYSSKSLREQFFKENADIDINSRNKRGDTLALKAAKEKNLEFLKYLSTLEGVDWNACDANGENIMMHIVKSLDFKMYYKLRSLAPKINAGNFSIRDYPSLTFISSNEFVPRKLLNTPLEYLIETDNHVYMENFLENFSGINVMDSSNKIDKPPVFRAIDSGMYGVSFRELIKHPSFDINAKLSNGKNIIQYAEDSTYNWYTRELNEAMPEIAMKGIVKSYDDTGEITLEQIDALLNVLVSSSNRFNSINIVGQTSFNSIGDSLGHLLCYFNIDENDFDSMRKMAVILNKLCKRLKFDVAKSVNKIGQTPISMAIEYENTGLLKLFLEMYDDYAIKPQEREALRNCTNKKIHDLFKDRGFLNASKF